MIIAKYDNISNTKPQLFLVRQDSMADKKIDQRVQLAEMLCTKLCHDIANAAGPISNALEMLSDPEMLSDKNEIMDLLNMSSRELVNRVNLYRIAYGATDSNMENIEKSFMIIRNMLENRKIKFIVNYNTGQSDILISNGLIKTLINLLIICKGLLSRGSAIELTLSNNESYSINIECTGNIQDSRHMHILEHGCKASLADLEVEAVQFYYTLICAQEAEINIKIHKHEKNRLVIVLLF